MMKITISTSAPAQLEAESLVAVVLDHSPASTDKNRKPELKVASADSAIQSVAADLLGSGGGAKKFSSYDLRRVAGVAVRTLKSRGIRSFAFVAPPTVPAEEAVR